MKIVLAATVLVFSFFVLSASFQPLYATDAPVYVVAADQPLKFSFKRIGEKAKGIWIALFNQNNAGPYAAELVTKRAEELSYIVNKEDSEAYLETTVSRYITYVGLLGGHLERKTVEKQTVINTLSSLPALLSEYRDYFPSQTAQWLMLQQTVDTTNVLLSQANSKDEN